MTAPTARWSGRSSAPRPSARAATWASAKCRRRSRSTPGAKRAGTSFSSRGRRSGLATTPVAVKLGYEIFLDADYARRRSDRGGGGGHRRSRALAVAHHHLHEVDQVPPAARALLPAGQLPAT